MRDKDERGSYKTKNKKRYTSEYVYLAYVDDGGHFRYESAYKLEDLEQGRQIYHLETLNTFYRKTRSVKTLKTLNGLHIDLDCDNQPFPISYIDILEKWQELGFWNPPSEIRCTSPSRYHVILKLKPLAAFPDKISYWKKCAEGLNKAYEEFGADLQGTTNPVGYVRIPGSVNYKYHFKPIVDVVFSSNSDLPPYNRSIV